MRFRKTSKIGMFFLVTLVAAALTAGAAEKPIKLTLADTTAPVGLRGNGVKVLVEEITKHTNGRVKVEVHWGESLLKAKEILSGVKDGIVDMGFINPNYYPKEMMISGAFALIPQGPKKFENMHDLYFKCFDEIPAMNAELKALKLKPIHVNTVLSSGVVSTKPFTRFEDFKGKRIRAASRWWLGQLKGAGAVPVSVPWGDCYMALQTGTIDGVYTNLDGSHRTKLDEVAPHVYTCRELWVGVPYFYSVNLDKWNSLPKDVQEQLMAAGKAAAVRFADLFNNEWTTMIEEMKQMNCTVTHAGPEDIRKWVTMPAVKEMQDVWVKEMKDRGMKDAGDVMDRINALVAQAIAAEN